MNKLNDRNYIKFHLQELEGFSKFLKSRLNELDSYSNSFKFKYSHFLDFFRSLWKLEPFRYLVIGFGILLLLFGLTELLSIDHAPLNQVSPQDRPNIFGRFALFLGNVERKIRKAFYYLLSFSIVAGSALISLYVYRRMKGIPLDAPFLPHHSDVGTQYPSHNHIQDIQSIEHDTMPESLTLEGPLTQATQTIEHNTMSESLTQDHQNPIEPVESTRSISLSIIEHIENSEEEEKSRADALMKAFTSKRRELSHSLMRQIGTLNNTNSTELEAFLKDTLDQLKQLDQETLTDLQNPSNGIALRDTDDDFDVPL